MRWSPSAFGPVPRDVVALQAAVNELIALLLRGDPVPAATQGANDAEFEPPPAQPRAPGPPWPALLWSDFVRARGELMSLGAAWPALGGAPRATGTRCS